MSQRTPDDEFRRVLTGEDPGWARFRNVVRHFPASPRCKLCLSPFEGIGGAVFRQVGFARYPGNPAICSNCIKDFRKKGLTGAEIPVSLLFADVRGSTGIAEGMRPPSFAASSTRSTGSGSDVILGHDGLVDKLVGDEIIGLFFGGISGPQHVKAAIEAAIELVTRVGQPGCVAEGADPARRRCPHWRGICRDDRPSGGRRRFHRARRRRQHDGAAGFHSSCRGGAGQHRGSRSRRLRREWARAAEPGAPWPSRADRRRRDQTVNSLDADWPSRVEEASPEPCQGSIWIDWTIASSSAWRCADVPA